MCRLDLVLCLHFSAVQANITYFANGKQEQSILHGSEQLNILASIPGDDKPCFVFCRSISIQYVHEKLKDKLRLADEEVFAPVIEFRTWKVNKKIIKFTITIHKPLPKSDQLIIFPADVGRIDNCETTDEVRTISND